MIREIHVKNFQSLEDVHLTGLDKLTVIVGPSSSGKSALVRAMRLVAFNASGSGFVTHGAKSSVVGINTTEAEVSIDKGKGVSRYMVDEQVFDKCGTSAPDEASKVLRIGPGNFSGQFDRPFLLDDTGAAVARELGELTNVSIILEAAREGNRRKTEVSGQIKTREKDLAYLVDQVTLFAGLSKRVSAVEEAETLVAEADIVGNKITRLGEVVTTLHVAEGVVSRLSGSIPEVPDLTAVEEAKARLEQGRNVLVDFASSLREVLVSTDLVKSTQIKEEEAHQAFHAALKEAGTCPLCGQETK